MAKKQTKKQTDIQILESENVKIEVRPYEKDNLLGFATVTIYESIKIYNCKLMKSKAGNIFISFPTYKGSDDNYYNYVYIDKDDELSVEISDLLNDNDLPFV